MGGASSRSNLSSMYLEELLLEAYPGGARVADEQGHLPLQCAIVFKSVQPKYIASTGSEAQTCAVVKKSRNSAHSNQTPFVSPQTCTGKEA
jgi:hypothetical protein